MTKKRKILLIVGIPVICLLLFAGLFVCAALSRSEPVFDYDDPEKLWQLAERTERYIIQSTERDSSARKEALKALEDIALLDVPDEEKRRLIRERFPEESFWTDDVKNVLKQAEAGDAEAQFRLGCFYSPRRNAFPWNYLRFDADPERGRCVMKSYAQAVKWFRKAAMQGHAKAQRYLGDCLLFGHPAYRDIDDWVQTIKIEEQLMLERMEWFTKAGIQGDPFALNYGYGPAKSLEGPLRDAGAEENRRSALAISRKAAEQGDVEAMLLTASLLSHFHDDRGAAEWLRRAAEKGDVRAMMQYAYYHEKEMEREMADDDTGPKPVDWEWRRKAFDIAMKRLDEGSAEELREALDSFCLVHLEEFTGGESAADFIPRLIPRLLDLVEHHGDYDFANWIIQAIPQTFRVQKIPIPGVNSETLLPLRAELGIYVSQAEYAWQLQSGSASDQAEALRLLRKLAGFGYANAQHSLGSVYFDGKCGVPKDKAEAVKWLRKAAEQRLGIAMDDLSACLLSDGEPRSWSEAVYWGLRHTAYPEYDSFPEYLINSFREKLKEIRRMFE